MARLALLCCLLAAALPAGADTAPIEATTATGDKVLLQPNGRWQYVDPQKAAVAKQIADRYPENHLRPEAAQGGWMGLGRTVMPGDKDYNRGSLSGKGR
ncbi:MAG: hypothetical protein AB7U30_09435 [Sulfuricellaceae bacterium]|jgi:hypothetical protein